MKKHAGIAISGHLHALKCQNFPGFLPWTPLGGAYSAPQIPRLFYSLASLGR